MDNMPEPIIVPLPVDNPKKDRALWVHLDQLQGPDAVRILSIEIDKWLREEKTRTIKDLSKKSGLGRRTVSKIWYRETRYPQFLTCIMLFKALGFVAMRLE